ncbi:metallophosphoesterase family protein [Nucisporomicrobium flavum]|uniref:metallophosphoesterase family protein n=1 Tax=Nucisporomicrobium flavum TaxID=2785915 RepID=UPI0018F42AD7|nr:metallophosphoesterase [Nucisporomicrobium flavum]
MRAVPKRRLRITVAVLLVLVLVVLWLLSRCSTGPETVRVAAVGDMACDPADPDLAKAAASGERCRHQAVSDLAVAMNPAALIGLGDFQYELPKAEAYRTVYGPSFGRLLNRTIPVYGNQEYKVQDANTFTAYFGNRIRDTRGYWSQTIGRWHVVVLNSNCAAVAGGCRTGSPQQTWLAQDLAANDRTCVLAAWHHPRWSTGIAGPDPRTADLFRTLYDHRVDLVLSGHEADYERFAPLNPDGTPDPQGVRQFVIGTGGQAHYRPAATDDTRDEHGNPEVTAGRPAGEYADFDHHGVLELELRPTSYAWRFHPLEAEKPVTDEGTATCH